MLRSLCDVVEDAEVWALGLDDRALALAPRAPRAVRFVPLAELLDANAALAASRAARPAERGWLMTVKPAWLAFVLDKTAVGESLTYVDADMTFFESPAAIIDEAAASIVLSPQRFSKGAAPELFWGRFNAGWLGVRRDATGRAFLEAWQEDCRGRMSPEYSNQSSWTARSSSTRTCASGSSGREPRPLERGRRHRQRERGARPRRRPSPGRVSHGRALPAAVRPMRDGIRGRVLGGILRDRVYAPYLRRLRSVAAELGVAPVDTLDRVNWPAGLKDRWLHRVALGLGWARGEAVRF